MVGVKLSKKGKKKGGSIVKKLWKCIAPSIKSGRYFIHAELLNIDRSVKVKWVSS